MREREGEREREGMREREGEREGMRERERERWVGDGISDDKQNLGGSENDMHKRL